MEQRFTLLIRSVSSIRRIYGPESRPSPSLTLVTCYPFYFVGSAPQRYIVSAFLARRDDRNAGQAIVPINEIQLEKEKP